jgi:hypothetical protein
MSHQHPTTFIRRLGRPLALVAVGAVVFAGFGTAAAATGEALLLGRSNTASDVTTLTNDGGVPLSLHAGAGAAPLRIDSPVEVRRLNAARLAGLRPADIESAARAGLTTAWQVAVNRDGSTAWQHDGMTVTRTAPGDYTVAWTGFPGAAMPYCNGVGRAGVVVTRATDTEGNGNLRVDFNGVDTRFNCVLIGLTG